MTRGPGGSPSLPNGGSDGADGVRASRAAGRPSPRHPGDEDSTGVSTYRVVTSWDGRQWMVRVEDSNGYHLGETTALRLPQAETNAHALLERDRAGHGRPTGGRERVLAVEVQLQPDIDQHFDLAEDLIDDASGEVQDAVDALQRTGMAAHDIAALLASRSLTAGPRRALLVPNAEVAATALDCRPDAVAVTWEDRGYGVTTYCRQCVDTDRSPWLDLPQGTSALIYDGPVRCDGCDRHVPTPEQPNESVHQPGTNTDGRRRRQPESPRITANESATPPSPTTSQTRNPGT